jgi:hypothetical protein
MLPARWGADTRFRDPACAARHDIHRLRRSFGTSFEQTCHRNRRGTVPTPYPEPSPLQGEQKTQFASFGKKCSITLFASRDGRSVSASRQHQLDFTSASTSSPRLMIVS